MKEIWKDIQGYEGLYKVNKKRPRLRSFLIIGYVPACLDVFQAYYTLL